MNNALFSNCSFRLSTSEEVEAKNAVFKNCDFTEADFGESDFKDARLEGCDFACITLERSCIEGTQFILTIPDAEEISYCFKTSKAFNADVRGVDLEQQSLS